jgi:hypothetical protein
MDGAVCLVLRLRYINVAMEICMHHPIMGGEESTPTLPASLHNPVRVFLPLKEEQRRLFFIRVEGGLGGREVEGRGGREATNVWRKLKIEVLNAAKAEAG